MAKNTIPINDMHVIVDLAGKRASTAIAIDLAERVDSHLTGISLAVVPLVPVFTTTTPIPADLIVEAHEQAAGDAKAASAAFEKLAKAAGIRFASTSSASLGGDGFGDLTRHLSLSDLVVVSQQNPDQPEPMREALIETVLFQAGVPALVVPYAGTGELTLQKAVVAWDGSATAAHAIRAALPLLRLAKEVTVVSVSEGRKRMTGMPAADIATYLARHGLEVSVRLIENRVGDISQTLLSFATDENAGWMVMGAYGHSRMRELLLGGATRGILTSMTLPILMAH